MFQLRIDSAQLKSLGAKMGPTFALEVKKDTLRRYAPALQRKLVENSPVKGPGRTGNLARNWRVEPIGGGAELSVRNTAKYAKFVEEDTKPHKIPKSGIPGVDRKVLVWRTGRRGPISAFKAGGSFPGSRTGAKAPRNFIFMPKVIMHPGTKGQHIVPRSIKDTLEFLEESFKLALNNVVARFAGTLAK